MEQPEYTRWEDLLPVLGDGFADPYEQLSPRQLAELAMLARMVRLLEAGKADAEGGMARDADRIRRAFARDGLDADYLLSLRESVRQNRIRLSHNPSLDGRQLRLLGQMLPLSRAGDHGVTEFLLTAPVIGVCNHTLLPPNTQIAYVKTGEPVDMDTLVCRPGARGPWGWVEGTIRYGVSTHIANWFNGQVRVEASYSIEPDRITPASDVELAQQAELDRQASEARLYPGLARSGRSTMSTTAIPAMKNPQAPSLALPVTILTGFLGSGKTTLLNHILTNQQGLRTAVLVNEFGEIGIDGQLIVNRDDGMIELSNGCICCSINGELSDAVRRILVRPQPVDYLVVETTGLANPLPVAMAFLDSSLRERTRLDSIITVVDAENFTETETGEVTRSQVAYGDILLLNKCDLVDEQRLAAVERRLKELRKDARILRSVNAKVPLDLLLNVGLFESGSAVDGRAACDHAHGHCEQRHAHTGHPAIEGFTSVSFAADRPLSLARVQDFLDNRLPAGVFRAKGILWFEENDQRHVLHLAGKRLSIERDDWPGERRSRLVLIGKDLEHEALQAQLAACLAQDHCAAANETDQR